MSSTGLYTERPFITEGSQAIKIHNEYRLEDSEVIINRIGNMITITPKDSLRSLFYEGLSMLSDDFMAEGRPVEVSNREVVL